MADRLRASLENLRLRSSQGQLLPPITVSIVAVQEPGMGCQGLIAAADGALYGAKEGGRNRVVLAA